MTPRRPIIVGNWKMNLGGPQGLSQLNALSKATDEAPEDAAQLVVLPPFTALPYLADHIGARATPITYGAQDISTDDAGTYTGEISGSMLIDVGCRYALAGHSERRDRHFESDKTVNAKIRAALRHGLTPILCVGEGLDVRQKGTHVDHTLAQLDQALADVDAPSAANMLIAYEPIWAIGTGEVATPEDAQEVCAAIRGRTAELFDHTVADQIRILYGGSVKSATSREILTQPDIDGALVGGASLDADELIAIWQTAKIATVMNPPPRRKINHGSGSARRDDLARQGASIRSRRLTRQAGSPI